MTRDPGQLFNDNLSEEKLFSVQRERKLPAGRKSTRIQMWTEEGCRKKLQSCPASSLRLKFSHLPLNKSESHPAIDVESFYSQSSGVPLPKSSRKVQLMDTVIFWKVPQGFSLSLALLQECLCPHNVSPPYVGS